MSGEPSFITWEAAVRWLRKQPDKVELVRAAYYDDPLLAACERYRSSEEWETIRAWLRGRIGSALDVGAGRGIASYALAKEGFAVSALEPDPSSLVGAGAIRSLAHDTELPIHAVEEFSERLPFADDSFDIVFARAVLHHTTDLKAACREFYRVQKPGGLFIAVREHVLSKPEDLPAFLDAHPLHKLYGGEHAFLLNDYQTALDQAGFETDAVLRPLESPVNYSPNTKVDLRDEIVARLSTAVGGSGIWESLLTPTWVLNGALRAISAFDSRPGRLYSFVCHKPR
ncbi:MAG: SAM-dependent methyltransferase [Gemmatimonadetes bacterium]|nr:SAM-dependent methyltransferase [Gemmatimonadota bacterium]